MKRWILGVALFALTASSALAAQPPADLPGVQPAPSVVRPPRHQPRFKYSSYGVWVRTDGPGYPAYRYTWRGQKDNFPMPAIFQSGSEHTNFTWGSGLE